MEDNFIREKAQGIRDVIRYIQRFKNAVVIIYLDDSTLDSPLFLSHIKDICAVHNAGLKVILVPGSKRRINEILDNAGIEWHMHNNCRITGNDAMPLIKMAAFDVSNQIMTAFAGEKKTALIGNWVRSRGKGVIDGVDYGTSGEIDRLEVDALKSVLDNGFIPIFPCIGWSAAGKPYNISSIKLAQEIAVHLKADKLFYLVHDAQITGETFKFPSSVNIEPKETVPALDLSEVDEFIRLNSGLSESSLDKKILSLMELAKDACQKGVNRVHLLNAAIEGTVTCEIFSDFGSGTMIYSQNYGRVRNMTKDDISGVLSVMQPFIDQGILLPRTKESLGADFGKYVVYELDGAIRGCACLVPYSDGQMEIAGVAVNKNCSSMGIGPKLIEHLVKKARSNNAKGIFLLTTKTADWFENLGFVQDTIDSIPEERRNLWTPSRGSKVLRLK